MLINITIYSGIPLKHHCPLYRILNKFYFRWNFNRKRYVKL